MKKNFLLTIMAVVPLFALGATGASGRSPSSASHEGFCGPRVARNFLKPLARMRPISRVPGSERLSFGPQGLVLEAKGGLVVGGGSVGFSLRNPSGRGTAHLTWKASTQLVKVDLKGAGLRRLASKQRRVRSVADSQAKRFLLEVPGRPAYYRVDISFRDDESNRILGRFSEYIRVVRPRFDARLLISKSVARPGDLLSIRLANHGTEGISSRSHNWRFQVERFDGEKWAVAPGNPPTEKHILLIRKLGAGEMDKCISFRVSSTEPPGLYRVSMYVDRNLQTDKNRRVQVTAGFEVISAS